MDFQMILLHVDSNNFIKTSAEFLSLVNESVGKTCHTVLLTYAKSHVIYKTKNLFQC